MSRGPATAVAALLLASVPAVHAHPFAPSVLEITDTGTGRLAVGWKVALLTPRGPGLSPLLPARCHPVSGRTTSEEGAGLWTRWMVDCGPGEIVGERVGVTGAASTGVTALVRVTLADGRLVQGIVSAADPVLTIPPRARPLDVIHGYGRLGIAHILAGPDHLLFVFGLILLAGPGRRLLATVSAFTVGHSITLTLAALGVVDVPSRPIELAIAASVLLLAVELARLTACPTLIRRRPWTMAAVFGLLHGLGFAGALREAGLPAGEIPLALLSFNVGIELGQLLFVVAVLAVRRAAGPLPARLPVWTRRVPVYGMGSLAAYWALARAVELMG